jgi:hypothetical protein
LTCDLFSHCCLQTLRFFQEFWWCEIENFLLDDSLSYNLGGSCVVPCIADDLELIVARSRFVNNFDASKSRRVGLGLKAEQLGPVFNDFSLVVFNNEAL